MENLIKNLILVVSLFLILSCAKPTVVETVLPGDDKLNCEQLEYEIAESQKIKREAEYAREGTGGNMTRLMLFWPAWAQTLHNADTAIMAAEDRIFHLVKIMKKKKCKGVNIINAQISEENDSSNNIAKQLKILKKMYDDGDLTKEEYSKAKKKVLE